MVRSLAPHASRPCCTAKITPERPLQQPRRPAAPRPRGKGEACPANGAKRVGSSNAPTSCSASPSVALREQGGEGRAAKSEPESFPLPAVLHRAPAPARGTHISSSWRQTSPCFYLPPLHEAGNGLPTSDRTRRRAASELRLRRAPGCLRRRAPRRRPLRVPGRHRAPSPPGTILPPGWSKRRSTENRSGHRLRAPSRPHAGLGRVSETKRGRKRWCGRCQEENPHAAPPSSATATRGGMSGEGDGVGFVAAPLPPALLRIRGKPAIN